MIDSQQYLALKAVQEHIKQQSMYQQEDTQNPFRTLLLWFKEKFGHQPSRNPNRKRLRRA